MSDIVTFPSELAAEGDNMKRSPMQYPFACPVSKGFPVVCAIRHVTHGQNMEPVGQWDAGEWEVGMVERVFLRY